MASLIALASGYKFAILALPDARVVLPQAACIPVGDRLAATSTLPDGALETWKDSIGRFHRDELSETSLFLWATAPSASPQILDHENEELKREVYRFYLGLLIAIPYLSHGRVTSLTGANADGTPRVRSLTTYSRTYYTLGAPGATITAKRIRLAGELATAIKAHDDRFGQSRFTRFLRTFREAAEAPHLDDRLHQFVRCAEGIVVPPFAQGGRHFAKRLRRVCAGRALHTLRELYTIRGGIEHLHGPYGRLPRMSKRRRWVRVLLRTVQAEALARYLVLTYLTNSALWPVFADRASIEAFWNLKPTAFRKLWPTRIDFASIERSFDYSALDGYEHDT